MSIFRSVADRFGITKSTCWQIVHRIACLLLEVNEKFKIISWPNHNRQQTISNYFRKYGFPGINIYKYIFKITLIFILRLSRLY